MNKKWVCNEVDVNKVNKIKEKYNLTDLLSSILVGRDIAQNEEKLNVFLNPTRKDFYDPFLLPDMEIAVNRIIKAINNKEKIMIYGDYDVDGITSICVLKKFLEARGVEVEQVIPNRLEEGYGLNKDAVEKIAK